MTTETNPAHNDLSSGHKGSASKADALLSLLDLQPGMTVLEVGCGQAEYAIRLLDIFPSIAATASDPDAGSLAQARERAGRADVSDRLTLIQGTPRTAGLTPASFDVALCVGAAWAFDSYRDALRGLAAWVRPGGLVLIADGYWHHEPLRDRSAFPHPANDFYPNHASNVAAAEEAALVPLYAIVGMDDAWDEYDNLYAHAVACYVAAHPNIIGITDVVATRNHIGALCRMNLRLSQDMLGFGWYLFQRGLS